MAALPARLSETPPRRRALAGPLLAAALAVLWLHASLMQLLVPGGPRPGPVAPAAMQVRTLNPPLPPPRADGPAPVQAAASPPRAALADAPAVRRPAPLVAAEPALPAAPAEAGPPTPSADTAAADASAQAAPVAPAESAAPPTTADSDAANPAQPPPLYATRLPEPAQLRYALRYNGQAGEALLTWRHDGQRYSLVLDGVGAAGRPLVAQTSQGRIDEHGLAPDRFVDRRRQGRQQAANFRRDAGRISYSGPSVDHPAWPGAQDRLSWLVQLAAILAAGPAPGEVALFVADARGSAGLWRLQPHGSEAVPAPGGETLLALWQREPPRPEGLRVQAWVDPARGHWPVRLRFTALRSGEVFELQLLAEPTAPPPSP